MNKVRAFGIMSVLTALGIISVTYYAAHRIRLEAIEAGRSVCPTCKLDIKGVAAWPLWLGSVRFEDVSWKSGSPGALEISAAARSIEAVIALRPLFSKTVDIDLVDIQGLEVGLTDGEGKEPGTKTVEDEESEWAIIIRRIQTSGAEFTYVRNKSGTHAGLDLHNINLQTETFGLQGQWLGLPVKAKADLRLEKSGAIHLELAAHLKKPLNVDVALFVKEQNLADLTPFFAKNAGVELSGELQKGRGIVHVRGENADAEVLAIYRDLKVKIKESYDRNELTAYFMTLGASVGMSKKSTNKPADDQVRRKKIKREPGEPVIGFILRALKETAIAVTLS